jgi:hypothetical protein
VSVDLRLAPGEPPLNFKDLAENVPGILEDALVGDTLDGVTERDEIGVAFGILLFQAREVVHGPVELDDQAILCAVKVDDIGSNLMLTPKFETGQLAIPDHLPKNLLGRRLFLAQPTGDFNKPLKTKSSPPPS